MILCTTELIIIDAICPNSTNLNSKCFTKLNQNVHDVNQLSKFYSWSLLFNTFRRAIFLGVQTVVFFAFDRSHYYFYHQKSPEFLAWRNTSTWQQNLNTMTEYWLCCRLELSSIKLYIPNLTVMISFIIILDIDQIDLNLISYVTI